MLQAMRYKRHRLRQATSWLDLRRFSQITKSSHTLEITRRLQKGSSRKISPFLASQILHSRVSSTNGHKFRSRCEGMVAVQKSESMRVITFRSLSLSQSSKLDEQEKKRCPRSSGWREHRRHISSSRTCLANRLHRVLNLSLKNNQAKKINFIWHPCSPDSLPHKVC